MKTINMIVCYFAQSTLQPNEAVTTQSIQPLPRIYHLQSLLHTVTENHIRRYPKGLHIWVLQKLLSLLLIVFGEQRLILLSESLAVNSLDFSMTSPQCFNLRDEYGLKLRSGDCCNWILVQTDQSSQKFFSGVEEGIEGVRSDGIQSHFAFASEFLYIEAERRSGSALNQLLQEQTFHYYYSVDNSTI